VLAIAGCRRADIGADAFIELSMRIVVTKVLEAVVTCYSCRQSRRVLEGGDAVLTANRLSARSLCVAGTYLLRTPQHVKVNLSILHSSNGRML